jgi:diguanylate cyclase (GGDEF)-like protein
MCCKRHILLFFMVFLVIGYVSPVFAYTSTGEGKVVRVGWYESAFHHTDEYGRRSGYGYEYQQEVATYTGWSYEYVEGSWSELFEMLVAGEIDLLSDVSYTPERAQKVLYSSEGMGSEDYHAFIVEGNTEIKPNDFSTFNGKRVGVNKNSIQEQLFLEWAKNNDVTPDVIELTEKSPELIEMLRRGEIDILVTLDAYGSAEDIIPVCKVGSSDFFFGINKNRPDLKKELDMAMNRILEDNRYYNQQMNERYIGSQGIRAFLSEDEISWLKEHGPIRVGYMDDYMPFCDEDGETGHLTGALLDFLKYAETSELNADITFETKSFKNTEEAIDALLNNEIDCVYPVTMTSYEGEALGIICTDPLVRTEMYAAIRESERQSFTTDRELKVSVLSMNPSYESFIKDYFPAWSTVYFEAIDDGFSAVASGETDMALVSNYRLNRLNRLRDKYNLVTITTGKAMEMSMSLRRKDNSLYSIFNKVIRLYPDTAVNGALTKYAFTETRVTLRDFLEDNLLLVLAIVCIIALAIAMLIMLNIQEQRKSNERRQIISETERDQLTGLYNWNFFLVYANKIFREQPEKHMDAVVMNIDRFHSVNAIHGRDFGDKVLKALGEEIQRFADAHDGIASRVEADRFDMYCPPMEDWQKVAADFQTKLDSLSHNASIRLRMGVKPWEAGQEPVQQFDCARTACGMIKGDYTSNVIVYDREMGRRETRNQQLLNDLRRGLEEGQFQVWYQPKYNIQCDPPKLSSAEALVRWNHPELGMISPGEFIPLLEASGQISLLDHYVWEETARQVARWRDELGVVIPVSMNLSRVDIFDPGLEDRLHRLIEDNHLSPEWLKLEVTESAYTENANQLIRLIERLRKKGYEFEMDDFGSGYSSLNMLSSMPIDVLKMDMVFIKNIERNEKDFRLVELILDIARYLKVPVIAEGVETENQMRLLKEAGCDIVQGYFFSRPLPADEFKKNILLSGA